VKFEQKDGKWAGSVTSTRQGVPAAKLDKLVVTKEALRFTLHLQGSGAIPFEAKLPPENEGKILGNVIIDGNVMPAVLERTTLPSLSADALAKETLATRTSGPEVVEAALTLIKDAAKNKAKPEEVRSWADKAVKNAEPFGSRWKSDVVLNVAEMLSEQEGYGTVALQYARQAERGLGPKELPGQQRRVLETLASALKAAGKADEAKEIEARIAKIETKITPEPYAGRKAKSDRVVLVELFTGAQCPPCVAADMAFDALGKAFKPSEVILLQYHLHVPGPDPLTNADTELRARFYGRAIQGTPTIFFNGKPGPQGGGSAFDAAEKYAEYVGLVEEDLETPAKAKIQLGAARKGAKIEIKAEVSDLAQTGEDVRLRLVLVEEEVKYEGGNKLPTHHHVVRSFPGGVDGLALKDKTGKKTVTVDLEEVRKGLKDYLDKYAEKRPFPGKERPLELKKLFVVAFVQNDETGEILQAAQVEVKGE
jgi:hypothetical protein